MINFSLYTKFIQKSLIRLNVAFSIKGLTAMNYTYINARVNRNSPDGTATNFFIYLNSINY